MLTIERSSRKRMDTQNKKKGKYEDAKIKQTNSRYKRSLK